MSNDKKKIVIIGAGIAGLTAGIYALDNDFDVTIYEMHNVAGGECTGWKRDGVFIDGCAHWIVGTNPKGQLFKLWKHIGAFDENTVIHETEYFNKYDIDGEVVTFYSDLKKLKAELLRVGPDDGKVINEFIRGIKAYQHVQIPVKKPMDMMNAFDYMGIGIKMLPMIPAYFKYKKITINDFAEKCKSETLKKAFKRSLFPEYNLHSLLYIMQALSKTDAGVAEGGSLKLAYRIVDRFKEKGGKLFLSTPVEEILVENDKACGVLLKNGEKIQADYVVAACDAHHILHNLLKGKYKDEFYDSRFDDRKKNPLSLGMVCSYKVTCDMKDKPKMVQFPIEPFNINKTVIEKLSPRNHAFDDTLNDGTTTITCLLRIGDDVYDYYKAMTKEEYNADKERVGNIIMKYLIDYYKIPADSIKLIDVTTPLTYERYCNAYRGSYQSFVTTGSHGKLMGTGLIDGLSNFVIAGQWVMPPGGLPIALFTGRHAAYRITRWEHKKFKAN